MTDSTRSGNASGTIELRVLVAVEHAVSEGEYSGYRPERYRTLPVRSGDRVWFRADVPENVWVYGIGSNDQTHYRREWVSSPENGPTRMPWAGHVVGEEFSRWDRFLVVASHTELDWVVPEVDCPEFTHTPVVESPDTPCEHLNNMHARVHEVRGHVEPTVEFLSFGDRRLPALEETKSQESPAVVGIYFKPRDD